MRCSGEIESEGVTHRIVFDFTFRVSKRPGRVIDFAPENIALSVCAVQAVSRRQPVFQCLWLSMEWFSHRFVAAAEIGGRFVAMGSVAVMLNTWPLSCLKREA